MKLPNTVKDLNELLKSKKIIKNKNLPSTKNIEKKYNQLLSYVSDEYKIDSTIIANKRDIDIFLTSNKTKFMSGGDIKFLVNCYNKQNEKVFFKTCRR